VARLTHALLTGRPNSQQHTGIARILSWGALFSSKKLTTFFQSSSSKDGLKILIEAPNLPRTAKIVLKIDSYSAWRCTWCAGGALTNFPCKLHLKFFICPGWCKCTHCTPWLCLCSNSCTNTHGQHAIRSKTMQNGDNYLKDGHLMPPKRP